MDKLVFVKDLQMGTTKGGKDYPIITDQENSKWHVFQDGVRLEPHKAYLFTYTLNDKGFNDIQKITPLTNIFQQRALKEVASRNDIVRNLGMMLSYAKDLVVAGTIPLDQMYSQAYLMYDWVQQDADKLMPKDNDEVSNQ